MSEYPETRHGPWYRNRMVWLVIGIPLATVAGCMLTIYLAISHPVELVSDYSIRSDTGQSTDR